MAADNNDRSPHILNASSNLLGLCFVVLTSLKLLNISGKTIIDELTTIAILFFMSSCILSFLSIRGNIKKSGRKEKLADIFFLGGLTLLFVTALLFSFDIIK
jgi:tRNA(His) 5'-end guanylyltransferase